MAASSLGFPILTVAILLPAGAAAAMLFIPATRDSLAKPLGLAAALAEVVLVAALVVEFKAEAGFQFVSRERWLGPLGINWHLGVDGISLFLVAVTALLFPVAMAGPRVTASARSFMGWMLLLEAACMGAFLALDLFVFFVMFEITLVPGYFLIVGWGGERRRAAAMRFFLFTFSGSAFLLVGIIGAALLTARYNGGRPSFDLITLTRLMSRLPGADQVWIFAAVMVSFAVKIPLVPFHRWLPDTYTEAPTAGSMVIAGILFQLGAYGALRFGIFMIPRGAVYFQPALLTMAVVGVTYGALITILQRDLKRLVAHTSIFAVGFVVLGLFAFSDQSVVGGVLSMVNEALIAGALFFLVGIVAERRETLRISELGGLQRSAPVLAAVFLAVTMAAVGLPGLNGFVGEFLVLVGAFVTHRWWAVVATTGVVTGAVFLLWAYQRVFHGPMPAAALAGTSTASLAGTPAAGAPVASSQASPYGSSTAVETASPAAAEPAHPVPGAHGGAPPPSTGPGGAASGRSDMSLRELAAVAPLLAAIVFLGIYPKPFLDRVTPSVDHLLEHVQAVDSGAQVPSLGRAALRYRVPASQAVEVVVPGQGGDPSGRGAR